MLLLAWIEAEIEQNTMSAVRYLQGELVCMCVCVCVCVLVCSCVHVCMCVCILKHLVYRWQMNITSELYLRGF